MRRERDMAVEVVMPKLGMAMKEGIITSWNIKAER